MVVRGNIWRGKEKGEGKEKRREQKENVEEGKRKEETVTMIHFIGYRYVCTGQ
jgi:hypothetical protein